MNKDNSESDSVNRSSKGLQTNVFVNSSFELYISDNCAEVECQSTLRNIIDNDYTNIRDVGDLVLVDLKPFSCGAVIFCMDL